MGHVEWHYITQFMAAILSVCSSTVVVVLVVHLNIVDVLYSG